jgi:hypothetical protein
VAAGVVCFAAAAFIAVLPGRVIDLLPQTAGASAAASAKSQVVTQATGLRAFSPSSPR